jgi:hypothetical protein
LFTADHDTEVMPDPTPPPPMVMNRVADLVVAAVVIAQVLAVIAEAMAMIWLK